MDDRVREQLEQEEQTEFHKRLLDRCKSLVQMSHRHMSQFYSAWDDADDAYRGRRPADKQDAQARQRGEPEKMVVPVTYSQIQTFVAFCMALFLQRERLFELVGKGEEDHRAAKVGEALLARDLTMNVFESKLYQFLLDIARFGIGVLKTGWVRETRLMEVEVEQPPLTFMGEEIAPSEPYKEMQEVVTYLGNRVYNVSPYRFFPDVRLPLGRFQEGEFVASEDDYSMTSLRQMEREGKIAGVKYIKPMNRMARDMRGPDSRLQSNVPLDPMTASLYAKGSEGVAVLTECQICIVPSQFKLSEKSGDVLGDEDYPVKWNVWYVNDQRIVRAEPLGYEHGGFSYDVAEFSPDMHKSVNEGLAGTIDQLQSVVTWLINSHITNVRKVIQDRLIVDPSGIEMKDLTERRPVIRLTPAASRMGVDKWARQLDVRDVTSAHMRDANELHGIIQLVTGINDNALGQFYTGRRSATEARNVNSAAAARLKTPALLIFRNALEPMARKMLANHQQGLDVETYVRVVGELANPQDYQRFIKVTKADLVGDFDFEVFDGTLPSERAVQAQAIQEVLQEFLRNPEAMTLLGYDPRKLAEEWLTLRGIRHPKRFLMDDVRVAELMAQIQLVNGQQTGLPGKEVAGSGGINAGTPYGIAAGRGNGSLARRVAG